MLGRRLPRLAFASLLAAGLLLLLAGAGRAQAQDWADAIKPVEGQGVATSHSDDGFHTYDATLTTRFEPARIRPGEGVVYHSRLVVVKDGLQPQGPCQDVTDDPWSYRGLQPGYNPWQNEGDLGELHVGVPDPHLERVCAGGLDVTVRTTLDADTTGWAFAEGSCWHGEGQYARSNSYFPRPGNSGTVAVLAVVGDDPGAASACASDDCDDGVDNDGDGIADHPLDPGCVSAQDPSEDRVGLVCDDGLDNDGDGRVDFQLPLAPGVAPGDPGCESVVDPDERTYECGDGVSNDKDPLVDLADPGCTSADDDNEFDLVTLTVEAHGPGAVGGCVDRCQYHFERGEERHYTALPDEANDGFLSWSGCRLAAGRSCSVTADRDRTITARFDPIVSYAPYMTFHPREDRWPMDPARFIRYASLKWMNVRAGGRYVPCHDQPRVVARQGAVSDRRLGTPGGYRHRFCWRERRLGTNGRKRHTNWDATDHTSPSRKPGTRRTPKSRSGFVLDLDDRRYKGVKPAGDHGPPLYVEYEPGRYVIYWFFYGHNNVTVKIAGRKVVKDKHEGDWEHIAVRLDDDDRAEAVAYYQHYCGGDQFSWAAMKGKDFLADGNHPRVYVAKGAHASYPNRGPKPLSCSNPFKGGGDKVGSGRTWRTWAAGSDAFRRADAQPWYGFGGGWGDIADSSTSRPGPFWGPLGPGPLKFKDGAVPRGW